MTEESADKSLYYWNDFVLVLQSAPVCDRRGETGYVCGLWEIESDRLAESLKGDLGEFSYVVEFRDGSSQQFAERYLRLVEANPEYHK